MNIFVLLKNLATTWDHYLFTQWSSISCGNCTLYPYNVQIKYGKEMRINSNVTNIIKQSQNIVRISSLMKPASGALRCMHFVTLQHLLMWTSIKSPISSKYTTSLLVQFHRNFLTTSLKYTIVVHVFVDPFDIGMAWNS